MKKWTPVACASRGTYSARFRIQIRAGDTTVGDGPVSEQTLQIAGFNILECADLDEALEVASKNPGASFGILELRPIEP